MAYDNNTKDASGKSINDYKADYAAAAARGDAAGMKAANDSANAIRTSNGGAAQAASNDIAKVQSGGTSGIVSNPSAWDRGTGSSSESGSSSGSGSSSKSGTSSGASTKSTGEIGSGTVYQGGLGTDAKGTVVMQGKTPDGKIIDVTYVDGVRQTDIPDGTIVRTNGGDFVYNAPKQTATAQTTARTSASMQTPTVSPLANRAPDLQSVLQQWLQDARAQQELKINYAVEKGVNDLQRAEQDAREQFQTQRNQIETDRARASDNLALYNERRGDRGGIGAAQYNSIQNTAAQNQLTVNNAQAKLSTDTARQIADLRAQGEFQKADALLQLSQTYLSKLIDIEQWSAEFNLSVDQFNKQIEQWNNEFEVKVADLLGEYRGQRTLSGQSLDLQRQAQSFDEAYKTASLTGTFRGQQTLQARSALAEAGVALAQAGIQPSQSQIEAMEELYGYDANAVTGLVQTAQLAQQARITPSKAPSNPPVEEDVPDVKVRPSQWLAYQGFTTYEDAYDALLLQGFDEDVADRRAKAYIKEIAPTTADYDTYRGAYRTLLTIKQTQGVAAAQAKFYRDVSGSIEFSDAQMKDLKKLVGLE